MEQEKIDRINELTRLSKLPGGLSEEQKQERELLRREYIDSVLGNLRSQLDHTVLVDEKGNKRKLKERKK